MSDKRVDKADPDGAGDLLSEANGGRHVKAPARARADVIVAVLIFIAMFLVFWFSPVHQVTDSSYSMLVSQSLWQHRSFTLDEYAIPRNLQVSQDNALKNGEIYQLEVVNNHLYYFFPPGSSVLSVPFVFVMNQFGISAVKGDGTYNLNGEVKLEAILAALLMAAAAVTFFLIARLELPFKWSLLVALGAALGTQVWSTASRAMWSDTWGVFISAVVIYFFAGGRNGQARNQTGIAGDTSGLELFCTSHVKHRHHRHHGLFVVASAPLHPPFSDHRSGVAGGVFCVLMDPFRQVIAKLLFRQPAQLSVVRPGFDRAFVQPVTRTIGLHAGTVISHLSAAAIPPEYHPMASRFPGVGGNHGPSNRRLRIRPLVGRVLLRLATDSWLGAVAAPAHRAGAQGDAF